MTAPVTAGPGAPEGVGPVRLRLSRAKGFDLQALSLATNGLDVVKVARPGPFGNPFTVKGAAEAYDCRQHSAHEIAVRWFRDWIALAEDHETFGAMHVHEWTRDQHRTIRARLHELRGKNLACCCAPEFACHADVLLELANATPAAADAGAAP